MSRNDRLFLRKGDAVIIRAPLVLTDEMRGRAREALADAARAVRPGAKPPRRK